MAANNFDFAAVAMVPPNVPFFPAANHDGAGHEFSLGWEAGAFVEDVLARANRNMKEAKELLSRAFEQQARAVDAIAAQVEKDSGWKFMGLDPTPAPLADSSIGAAIETLIGRSSGPAARCRLLPSSRKPNVPYPSSAWASPGSCCPYWKTRCSPRDGAKAPLI
jgi:uncharacterized protein (UPF0210 family)